MLGNNLKQTEQDFEPESGRVFKQERQRLLTCENTLMLDFWDLQTLRN